MKRFLAVIALAAAASSHAACDSYVIRSEELGEFVVSTEKSFAAMPRAGMVGYTSVTPALSQDGDECVLKFELRNPVIRIGAEIGVAGSCGYEHVMKHEAEHVEIYRRGIKAVDGRVVQAPISAATISDLMRDMRAEHAAHDSPAEYDTNKTACGGAIIKKLVAALSK